MTELGPRIIQDAEPIVEAPGFRGYALRGPHVLPRRAPSPDEEQRMVEHVIYEIEAVCGLIRTFVHDAATESREFEWKTRAYFRAEALVAAYLLHVRVLDDFFYRDAIDKPHRPGTQDPEFGSYGNRAWLRRPDDVLAHDLVDDFEHWLEVRPTRPSELAEVRSRMNKAVLHLNWHRLDSEAWMPGHDPGAKRQRWDPMPPYRALSTVLRVFVDCTPSRLQPSLAKRTRSALLWPETLPDGTTFEPPST